MERLKPSPSQGLQDWGAGGIISESALQWMAEQGLETVDDLQFAPLGSSALEEVLEAQRLLHC